MKRSAAITTLLALALATTAHAQVSQSLSVADFVAEKSNWKTWAKSNLPFRITGRYGAIGGTTLRMEKCSLSFRSDDGSRFERPTGRSRNVLVTGRLHLQSGLPVFRVSSLRSLPSDASLFLTKQTEIRNPKTNAAKWYELASWAESRGAFYDDKELLARATQTRTKAFAIERELLEDDDIQGRLDLGKKAARLDIDPGLPDELTHEAFQLKFATLQTDDKAEPAALAEEFAKAFPAAKTPLDRPELRLSAAYWREPLTLYARSRTLQRRTFERFFYTKLMLASITRKAAEDGSNGNDIAAEIDRVLPERHDLAENYRDQRLDYEFARVGTYSRDELDDLVARFNKRKRPKKGREAVVRWVTVQEERLRKSGAPGLIQASDYHRSLLQDESQARMLLIEASKLDPDSQEVARRLDRMGYALIDGRWIPKAKVVTVPPSPIEIAIREGQVITGMTASQVRKTLGAPTSVTRVASAGHVNEVWIYRESSVAVHFLRRVRQAVDEAEVIVVSNVDSR